MLSEIKIPPKYLFLLSLVLGIAAALMPWARITYQPQSNLSMDDPNPLFSSDTPPLNVEFGPPEERPGVHLFSGRQPFGDYTDQWQFVWANAELEQVAGLLHSAGFFLTGASFLMWLVWVGIWLFKGGLSGKWLTPLRLALLLPVFACLVVVVLALLGPSISADYFLGVPYARVLDVRPFYPTILLAVLAAFTALAALLVKAPPKPESEQIEEV